MYIADSINSKEVSFSLELSEQLWVKVELLNNSYLLVGTIYRSPYINPNDSIAELCYTLKQVLETRPPYLLVAGDFNLPGIDWSSEKFSGNSYCVRPGSTRHILDLVFTNEVNMIKSINDHSGLTTCV